MCQVLETAENERERDPSFWGIYILVGRVAVSNKQTYKQIKCVFPQMINGMNKNKSRILQDGQGRPEKMIFEPHREVREQAMRLPSTKCPTEGISGAAALKQERSLSCAGTAKREVRLGQIKWRKGADTVWGSQSCRQITQDFVAPIKTSAFPVNENH